MTHPHDVAQGKVCGRALRHLAQRLALEIKDAEGTVGTAQHLAQVVVAVDALQLGQLLDLAGAGEAQLALGRAIQAHLD